jgi:hypothetical protein
VTEGSSQSVLTTISKQTNQKKRKEAIQTIIKSTFHAKRRLAKWEYFLREVTKERRNENLNRVKESTP